MSNSDTDSAGNFKEWLDNDWFTSGETSWEEYYDDNSEESPNDTI